LIPNLISNPCSRCGKARIVVKTWQELSGKSMVTYRTMACSDPNCQRRVDAQLDKEKAKRESFKLEALEKDKARKAEKAKLTP
jgi:hypothetical protein